MIKFMFLSICFGVFAQFGSESRAQDGAHYADFLDRQWGQLAYPIARPNSRFVLPIEEREWLNASAHPVRRNRWINRRYFELAKALNQCVFHENPSSVANWYHFATWASVSAGDVMNGKKFTAQASYDSYFVQAYRAGRINGRQLIQDREIDGIFQIANWAMKKTGVNQWSEMAAYFEEQKVIFAETNYEIAAEMIPIAEVFLKTFCDPKRAEMNQVTSADLDFFALFNPDEKELKKAFQHYRDAMLEIDPQLKLEKNLLASIEQVFFEQARVQKNLFHSLNSPLEPTGLLGPRVLTLSAAFFYGDQGVRMARDLRVRTLAPELTHLKTPELRKIFVSLGLEANDPGSIYQRSACKDWSNLICRKRFLAPLFRELTLGEPEIYAF
jgi:hypothetical protein